MINEAKFQKLEKLLQGYDRFIAEMASSGDIWIDETEYEYLRMIQTIVSEIRDVLYKD